MNVLIKPNQFSTGMMRSSIDAASWNRLIANPIIKADKTYAPLVIWGDMVRNPELDADGCARCTGDNVSRIRCLQVDYDSSISIDTFKRDYSRYSYQLYTSYSHGFKPGHRFRVIFPLAEPIMVSWLVPPVKEKMNEVFPEVDITCFDRAHWQILPCKRSEDAPYVYEQHQGERLSFARERFADIASEYKDGAHWRREIAEADRDPNANHSGALRKAQELLSNAIEGERNRTMYSVLCWLKSKVGADYGEAVSLVPPIGMEDEFRSMVTRIFG